MKTFLLFGVLVYVGLGLFLYLGQRDFIYFPVRALSSGFEQQLFEHDGEKIKATVLNRGRQKAVIYFGGNAENVDYNAENFSRLFPNYTLYLVKYRGYGGSSGKPTEAGLYADALFIYDAIGANHDEISVMGRSLGSAIATYLAVERAVERLVLITPFDSILSVAQSQYPIYPVGLLLMDRYDSYSRASRIKSETLIIAAQNDRIIHRRHTDQLMEGFSIDPLFHVIEGVGHNDLSSNPRYHALLGEFMRANVVSRESASR